MASISFVVKKTPAPPELILDYDSEISFNNTTEDFPSKEDFASASQNADAIENGSIMAGWVEIVPEENGNSYYNLKNIDLIGSNNFSYQGTNVTQQLATNDIRLAKLTGYNKVAVAYSDNYGGGEGPPATTRRRIHVLQSTNASPISGPIEKEIDQGYPTNTLAIPLAAGNIVWVYKQLGETSGTLFTIYDHELSSLYTDKELDSGLEVSSMKGAVLDDGNFVIAYTKTFDDSQRGNGVWVKTFDSSNGSLIKSNFYDYRCMEGGLSVTATDDGGFAVCFSDIDVEAAGEGANPEDCAGWIRIYKFDSTGNYENNVVLDFPDTDPGGGAAWGSICHTQLFKMDNGDLGLVGFNYSTKKIFTYVIDDSLNTVNQALTLLDKSITEMVSLLYNNAAVARFSNGVYGYTRKRYGASGRRTYVDVLVGGAST